MEPPFGRRNPKQKDILSDVLLFWKGRLKSTFLNNEEKCRPQGGPPTASPAQRVAVGKEEQSGLCSDVEGAVKILILKSRKGIEGPLNRPSGRRRFCAVRAFCRRQNLGAGEIHFRRAFQIPPDTIKITTPGRCGYFYGASGGTRTHTVSLPTDFESVTSTNSITLALDTGLLYKKAPGNSRPFSRRSGLSHEIAADLFMKSAVPA